HSPASRNSSAFFPSRIRPHPRSTLFPYTTLFRSKLVGARAKFPQSSQRVGMRADAVAQAIQRAGGEKRQSLVVIDVQHAYVISTDRKSTRLNSSHVSISYAVFCLKKKKIHTLQTA